MQTSGFYNPFTPIRDDRLIVGRENQLETLAAAILKRREKLVAITGNNATGKTTLWMAFVNRFGINIAKETEAVYLHRSADNFPEIRDETRLIVIEDLSFDFTPEIDGKIRSYIARYRDRQFLLVSAFEDFVKKFQPSTHIHLEGLPQSDSIQFLLRGLAQLLPDNELAKIANFTKGNPLLLNLVAHHVERGSRNLDEVFQLLSSNIRYQGQINNAEDSVLVTCREFKDVVSDVRIINGRLLDAIQKNPNAIYSLTPRQFEEMVAELMTKRGYHVDLTKTTRDGGKDLIIANHADIGNFIYYVECKRYAATNPVGVNVVRELAGTISADRVTAGLVITSSYFSPDAITFSNKIRHQMSLIDFVNLKDWINNCR
jgi:HJR/Mrr/RecB family endonuclease